MSEKTRKQVLDWQVDGRCRDCRADVHAVHEFAWMVKTHVWRKATERLQRETTGKVSTYDLCCVRCFERRLGRQLRALDFDWDVPLNYSDTWLRSKLLRQRMRV